MPHSATSVFFCKPFQTRGEVRGELRDLVHVLIERMAGDVEPEHLFFAGQLFLRGPIGNFGQRMRGGGLVRREIGEQSGLAAGAILPRPRADFHGAVDHGEELRARAVQRIERAGFDEAFDHAAVHRAEIDALAEIVERSEAAAFRARRDDRFDGVRADVLDRAEAEANALRRPGVNVNSEEFTSGGSTAMPISRHSLMYFTTLAVLPDSEVSSADMNSMRIVSLQIRRDERQVRVGGRVRLVEAVAGELLHQVEDFFGLLRRMAVGLGAVDEARALLGHLLGLLLAHGAAQQIGFAERVAGQAVGDLHHLLLVDHHAVGLFQDFLHLRQIVDHFLAAVLAIDEVVDHAHGAGAIERVQRDQILDAVRLIAAQNVAHARRFKLEHAAGVAPC